MISLSQPVSKILTIEQKVEIFLLCGRESVTYKPGSCMLLRQAFAIAIRPAEKANDFCFKV